MKKKIFHDNPYATNRGGKIEAPRARTSDVRATTVKGDDLRRK